MPDISATIRARTINDSVVSALVGTRMYADVIPQKCTMPAISYSVVDTVANEHLTGIADVSRARIQIDAIAKTRGGANALADAIRLALQMNNRVTTSGQFVNEINLIGGEEFVFEKSESGTDERRFINSQDFYVFYRTTTS